MRERMPRIDGERRQHRKDVAAKVGGQGIFLLVVDVLVQAQEDAFFFESGQELLAQTLERLAEHAAHLFADGGKLIARRHAVGAGADGDARSDFLLQAADADHEEFVEVGSEDGQELDPLQQRHGAIERFFENATIELQPAKLAIDVQAGIVERRRLGLDRGRGAVGVGHRGGSVGG